MTSVITALMSKLKEFTGGDTDPKAKIILVEKRQRQKIIKRQAAIEKTEVKQTWNFVYGDLEKVTKRDVYQIKDITFRQIWMEELFIFNTIVSKNPNPTKLFHGWDKYVLKWQPPGSTFRQLIPLNDRVLQEETMRQIIGMKKKESKHILFYFVTKDPLVPLYQVDVHPASLVSFHTRHEVLNKLCEFYREGKLGIDDLKLITSSHFVIWNRVLYNMLLPDWQPYHTYLIADLPKRAPKYSRLKLLELQYLKGKITFEQYRDEKFPEMKRLREEEEASYPRPYETGQCVVCERDGIGIIKCQSKGCPNLVCVDCINSKFLAMTDTGNGSAITDAEEGPFVFLHRRFCMKFGKRSSPKVVICTEPSFLRELQITGKECGLKMLPVINLKSLNSDDDDDEGEFDFHAAMRQAMDALEYKRRQAEMDEAARLEAERLANPAEYHALLSKLEKLSRSYHVLRKDIVRYQGQLEEKGHNERYLNRVTRLKGELLAKASSLVPEYAALSEELSGMVLLDKYRKEVESTLRLAKAKLAVLVAIESLQQLEDQEGAVEQEEGDRQKTIEAFYTASHTEREASSFFSGAFK